MNVRSNFDNEQIGLHDISSDNSYLIENETNLLPNMIIFLQMVIH